MLGYEMSDVDTMIDSIQDALKVLDTESYRSLHTGLWKAQDFLQGLWAEGYFDGYQD
jgi:hypothetical protein